MPDADFVCEWKPLTLPQLDFWEEFSFHPDEPVSTVAHCIDIEGEVDEGALTRAISQTIREAEVLSVSFRANDGSVQPEQRCDPERSPDLQSVDLRAEADPVAEAQRRMDADLTARLDLRSDKLSAHTLFRVGNRRYFWYMRAHHIIVDGYGLNLIEQRCSQLYGHFRSGGDAGQPFHRFACFLEEEEAYQDSRRWRADKAFWAGHLDRSAGLPALDKGAEDYGMAGYHHEGKLPGAFTQGLCDVSEATGIGWPDVLTLLAGLYLSNSLPGRAPSGEGDLTLWLPFMSRWGSVGAHMPALLVNILPFNLSARHGETLSAFLERAAGGLRTLRRHGRYRIEQIAADRGLAKGSRFFFSPLVNVLPFDTPVFEGCRTTRNVLGSGPGDGFNLTFRGEADARDMSFYIDADGTTTDASLFEQHQRHLPSFLMACVSGGALEQSVGTLWDGAVLETML